MSFLKKIKEKEGLFNALKTLTVVVLAFIAALFFRRSAGVLATFPIAFFLCGVAASIKINLKIKLAIFGGLVFILNTFENDDMTVTLIFTALCLLACLLFELSAKAITRGKKSKYYVPAISVVICFSLSFIFIGNPVSAIKANRILSDYTDEKYSTDDADFEFSKIYFNYKTRAYEISAVNKEYPTEASLISTKNGLVYDSFKSLLQKHLTTPYILEITSTLRNSFPNDSFNVSFDDIQCMGEKAVVSAKEGELYGRIVFEIHLGGVQTVEEMKNKIIQYTTVIDNAGIDYAKIIFKSGIDPLVRRCATVSKNRPFGKHNFTISHVPVFVSNQFNNLCELEPIIK